MNIVYAALSAIVLALTSAGALLSMVTQGFVRRRTPWMAALALSLPVACLSVGAVGAVLRHMDLVRPDNRWIAFVAWGGTSALVQLGYVVLCAWLLDARAPKLGE